MLVPDAERAAADLRSRYGLGSEPGPYLPFAGKRSHSVLLEPPAYLEFHAIEDRDAARATETGRRVLAVEAAGGGLFSWCVRVDNLEAVSKRLDIYGAPGLGASRCQLTLQGLKARRGYSGGSSR